jgi:hypothetical protein
VSISCGRTLVIRIGLDERWKKEDADTDSNGRWKIEDERLKMLIMSLILMLIENSKYAY